MLKITILEGKAEQKLKVEGKLAGPWVSELESAWSHLRQEGPTHQIVVDLSDLTFIDATGEAALTTMVAAGARLIAKGVYCEYVADRLLRRVYKTQGRRHRRNGAGVRH